MLRKCWNINIGIVWLISVSDPKLGASVGFEYGLKWSFPLTMTRIAIIISVEIITIWFFNHIVKPSFHLTVAPRARNDLRCIQGILYDQIFSLHSIFVWQKTHILLSHTGYWEDYCAIVFRAAMMNRLVVNNEVNLQISRKLTKYFA